MPSTSRSRGIAAAGVDVFVDLHGDHQGRRVQIVAARPAPILVNHLGFPGATGGGRHDYIIVNDVIVPDGSDAEFSETVLRLSGRCQANTPAEVQPDRRVSRAELGLGEGTVVMFFKLTEKVAPEAFETANAEMQARADKARLLRSFTVTS